MYLYNSILSDNWRFFDLTVTSNFVLSDKWRFFLIDRYEARDKDSHTNGIFTSSAKNITTGLEEGYNNLKIINILKNA